VPATLVYLARHGESDWNVAGRWQGHADRPLTARGRRQADELAMRLAGVPLDAVYASDLRRAWETAEPVAAAHGLEVMRLRELREVDVGSWSGLTQREAEERFPDGYRRWRDQLGTGWDDGETYEEMGARVVGAVQRLARRHDGGTVLVVSHGGAIRAILAAARGVDLATMRRAQPVTANAAVSAVVVQDGRLSEPSGDALD
jgi:probable phosphoglycerate mutase